MELNEKHRPSGVSRRIHTRDANGKKQSFDYIPNLPKYNKNLNFRQASKFQRINARPIEDPNGEDIDTVLKDGTIERKGLHLPKGYYDVNNVGGSEHWGIDPKTFAKKYEEDPEQPGVYKPKGGPMLASNPLKRNVSFQAPWGGRMDMKAGSRIMQDPNNPNDTYGIGGNEFDDTYEFDENRKYISRIIKESVNKVLMEKNNKLQEEYIRKIVKESVEAVLNEVDGYEDTMIKANPVFDKSSLRGKITRFFNPKKARQFDRIHDAAQERFDNAFKDSMKNFCDNFPNASDPYAIPSKEDLQRRDKDFEIMRKYNLGRNGYRDKYIKPRKQRK